MRQITIIVVGLFIIIGAILLMNVFLKKKTNFKPKEETKIVKSVKTQPIDYQNIQSEIILYGRVISALPLDIIAEVSGIIKRGDIPLKEGQSFQKGQVLFKIDDREADLALRVLKSTFLRNLAAILPDLKIDFPTIYDKWSSYFESVDLEQTLPTLPSIQEQKEKIFLVTKGIFNNYYEIKQREVNLEKYIVKANFSGTITQANAQEGAFTSQGRDVAKIIPINDLEIRIAVPVKDVKWIKIRANVQIEEESTGQTWRGRVARIGKVVNQSTQSIDAFISIVPNANYRVYDGMYLKATIPTLVFKKVMEVNREAIFNNNQVYIVESDSILKVQNIKVHKINPETIIISGLDTSHTLVTESLLNAHDGMTVKEL